MIAKPYQDWLQQQVDAGAFPSIDAAVEAAIQNMIGDDLSDDDLMWAKPLVDEGLAQLERGEKSSADDVFARLHAKLRALG